LSAELTWVDTSPGQNPCAEHTLPTAPHGGDGATRAAGPADTIACQETPVGIEPTSTGLQPVAWPSGSSVERSSHQTKKPGVRSDTWPGKLLGESWCHNRNGKDPSALADRPAKCLPCCRLLTKHNDGQNIRFSAVGPATSLDGLGCGRFTRFREFHYTRGASA